MHHFLDGAFDLHQPEVVKGNLRLRSTYLISAFAEAALCSTTERYTGFKIGMDGRELVYLLLLRGSPVVYHRLGSTHDLSRIKSPGLRNLKK